MARGSVARAEAEEEVEGWVTHANGYGDSKPSSEPGGQRRMWREGAFSAPSVIGGLGFEQGSRESS